MSVDAETYIVISLMFAVFAAVAAVGTSVVLGAGFERLRAGFETIKRQSGFFADAIYKLDQRTQKLDEETSKLKSGIHGVYDRMERVEKQTTFIADAVNSIEQRILHGTPAQPQTVQANFTMAPSSDLVRPQRLEPTRSPEVEINGWIVPRPLAKTQEDSPLMMASDLRGESMMAEMFDPYDNELRSAEGSEGRQMDQDDKPAESSPASSDGFSTLLSRYFLSEGGRGEKGIIYH
jgi:hypothetical protein